MSEEINILNNLKLLAVRILEELQGIHKSIYELEYHKVSLNLHEKVEKALKKDDDWNDGCENKLDVPQDGTDEEWYKFDPNDGLLLSAKKDEDEEALDEDCVNFNSEVIGAIIDESDFDENKNSALINKKTIIPKLLAKYGKKWKKLYDVSTADIISQIKQGIKEIEAGSIMKEKQYKALIDYIDNLLINDTDFDNYPTAEKIVLKFPEFTVKEIDKIISERHYELHQGF